jgi:hypothetical protein
MALEASDIMFLDRNRGDSMSGGVFMWVIVLVLIFFAFGWGGNFGNQRNNSCEGNHGGNGDSAALAALIATQNSNNRSYDLSQVERDVLTSSCKTQEDVFNTACATQKQILEAQFAMQLGFQNQQAQLAQCCCDIKTAIQNDGEQTRALMQGNTIQSLRDVNNELQRQLLVSQLVSQNQNQTNTLVDTLLPRSQPCYITCSPYMSSYFGTYGLYNNGNGNCCGNNSNCCNG